MRVAVLIIGLLLGAVMFVQTFLVNVLGQAGQDENVEQAGAIGVFMCLLWLIACAVVLSFPFVSTVLFVVAALLGFAMGGEFPDLAIWGGISLILAVMSFLGWLGKRKERRKFAVERARQEERDGQLQQLLLQRAQPDNRILCPSCNASNLASTRFCGNCGTALTAAPAS